MTTSGIGTIVIPVSDLTAAKALYGALLGVAPDVDQPYYVGYTAGGQHVGLDPQGHARGLTGPVMYWHVADIKMALDELLAAGAEEVQGVKDVGDGKLIATVRDRDGATLGLLQPA
ncbi:glyoxalase [Actinoplanes sp. ATCC 53533]|uniref:VOC family protein n=1 Tax=Actinoplanes sp. ATCC 53533 TaxID=1288362 RepID=UPI000F7AAE23|nr:VOC family protein [Actinoplanes sp. ATCC 53533]RSM52622.1 glyoxalase [Actinoplanes sp. ATCC 53533]